MASTTAETVFAVLEERYGSGRCEGHGVLGEKQDRCGCQPLEGYVF